MTNSVEKIFENLKIIKSFQTFSNIAQFLGLTKAALNNLKTRESIGSVLQKIFEKGDIGLDAVVATSHPHLYQLAKQTVDTAVFTNTADELEALLKVFYFQKTIQNAIQSVLFSPKQMPFFAKILQDLAGDKAAIIKLFRLVLGELQSQNLDSKNAKKMLIDAIKNTSKLKTSELSFFFQKDIDGLIKVVEDFDELTCQAIAADIPAVIEALESLKM